MTVRGRIAVLAVCVVVAGLVALYAAATSRPPPPLPPVGSVHLGPDPGADVPGYLAALPAKLPAAAAVAPALVALRSELTTADVGPLTSGTTVLTVVFRVPLPRVQTALRFEALEPGVPLPTALRSARQRAAAAAGADAGRLSGRPRAVAVAEAAALEDPNRACVLALVVSADGTGLTRLAARRGVRAVDAAPAGTTARELALSPLLPEQTQRADPLPDDGAVPMP